MSHPSGGDREGVVGLLSPLAHQTPAYNGRACSPSSTDGSETAGVSRPEFIMLLSGAV